MNKPHKKVKIINELYIAVWRKKIPLNLNFKNKVIKKVSNSLILIWIIKFETLLKVMQGKIEKFFKDKYFKQNGFIKDKSLRKLIFECLNKGINLDLKIFIFYSSPTVNFKSWSK